MQHLAKTEQYINLREVSLSLALGQGEYVVIPSTFARGEEGEFLLRYPSQLCQGRRGRIPPQVTLPPRPPSPLPGAKKANSSSGNPPPIFDRNEEGEFLLR